MHFREYNLKKFSGRSIPPRTPLEARAFGPSVSRGAHLLYHQNPSTSKLNETPEFDARLVIFFGGSIQLCLF